ncbi:hypothetical protein ZIOFF_023072 [Zingiber officinale]|uniref:Uncharacterized protein n=1 Tax=Zingiber officinale TaxID=94328 RepID=A0A8J5H650_ZINOF|nr:hypothetical protein ZIOFF_023072 [Zingiber officinale]
MIGISSPSLSVLLIRVAWIRRGSGAIRFAKLRKSVFKIASLARRLTFPVFLRLWLQVREGSNPSPYSNLDRFKSCQRGFDLLDLVLILRNLLKMPQPPMLQPQIPLMAAPVPRHSSNLGDLKSQIFKRLGQEQAQQYFSYLNHFLLQKLSKQEFNKLCILTLGHENIPLHNQLIRLIFHNACHAKERSYDKFPQILLMKKSSQVDDILAFSQDPNAKRQTAFDCDMLQKLPHKINHGTENYWIKDHSSNLGQNGMVEISDVAVFSENGDSKGSMQKRYCGAYELPPKRARIQQTSLRKQVSLDSKFIAGVVPLVHKHGKNYRIDMDFFKAPIQAPLGIHLCSERIGGAKRSRFSSGSGTCNSFRSSYDYSALYPTEALKKRIEKITQAQGLEGVTLDCANLLNMALDAYLKRLIRSCVELVGERNSHLPVKQQIHNLPPHSMSYSSGRVGNNTQVQGSIGASEGKHVLNMLDFKIQLPLPSNMNDNGNLSVGPDVKSEEKGNEPVG